MTQAGLCHTVIGSSPESCCTSSRIAHYSTSARPKPGRAAAPLVLTLVLLALQNSLIYHEEQFWKKQLSQNRAQQITTHACGGRGGIARGVQCSMRLPEVDTIGIRGWREAKVTCWSYGWESGGGGRNKKQRQLFFLSLSGRLKAHWQCSEACSRIHSNIDELLNSGEWMSHRLAYLHAAERQESEMERLLATAENCRWEEREAMSWNYKQ